MFKHCFLGSVDEPLSMSTDNGDAPVLSGDEAPETFTPTQVNCVICVQLNNIHFV